jgi:hypothetical protein
MLYIRGEIQEVNLKMDPLVLQIGNNSIGQGLVTWKKTLYDVIQGAGPLVGDNIAISVFFI